MELYPYSPHTFTECCLTTTGKNLIIIATRDEVSIMQPTWLCLFHFYLIYEILPHYLAQLRRSESPQKEVFSRECTMGLQMRSSAFTVLKLHLPSIQTVTSPYYTVIRHRCFIIGVTVNMSLVLLYLLSLIHKYLAVIRFRRLHSALGHNRTTLRTNK